MDLNLTAKKSSHLTEGQDLARQIVEELKLKANYENLKASFTVKDKSDVNVQDYLTIKSNLFKNGS